jgi:hypothetical protein
MMFQQASDGHDKNGKNFTTTKTLSKFIQTSF